MQNLKLIQDERGNTLIELMAAFFIISVGIMGALALTTNNLRNETIGANRLIATNLAREGIELARNVRDTNWQKNIAWDTGLNSANHCMVIDDLRTSLSGSATCPASLFDASQVYRLNKSTNGVYNNNTVGTTPTNFYRKIVLDPICKTGPSTEAPVTSGTCSAGTQIGIHVIVQVGVSAITGTTVTLEENLYNWR